MRTKLSLLLLTLGTSLFGQSSTATQTLQLRVLPVASLAVTGEPALAVLAGDAGQATLLAEDRTTRYRISTNRPALKLSASMNEALPAGMRLVMQVASSRGFSLGPVELSEPASPVTVVTGIGRGVEVDQEIAYRLLVDAAVAGPMSAQRTIVLTLTE